MNNANRSVGIGGAPNRAAIIPESAAERKKFPVASGCLDYFPDALALIAHVSHRGNEQHNPGKPMHWDRSKSGDEADTLIRHFLQRGQLDTDGIPHSAKMAWRALALLQKELEAAATPASPAPAAPAPQSDYPRFYTRNTDRYRVQRADAKPEYWSHIDRLWLESNYFETEDKLSRARHVTRTPAPVPPAQTSPPPPLTDLEFLEQKWKRQQGDNAYC